MLFLWPFTSKRPKSTLSLHGRLDSIFLPPVVHYMVQVKFEDLQWPQNESAIPVNLSEQPKQIQKGCPNENDYKMLSTKLSRGPKRVHVGVGVLAVFALAVLAIPLSLLLFRRPVQPSHADVDLKSTIEQEEIHKRSPSEEWQPFDVLRKQQEENHSIFSERQRRETKIPWRRC